MGVFDEFVMSLYQAGLLDVLLPFILIFTIAFAVLQKSKILGPNAHRFNVMVAFALSFAAIVPHVIGIEPDVVVIINKALPNVSLLMVASMMVLLLIGVFGNDVNVAGTPLAGIVVLFSVVAVVMSFLSASGTTLPPWLNFLSDPATRNTLVVVLVFGIIVWFITSPPQEEKREGGFEKFFDGMGKVFGGGHHGGGGHH